MGLLSEAWMTLAVSLLFAALFFDLLEVSIIAQNKNK